MVDLNNSAALESPLEEISQWVEREMVICFTVLRAALPDSLQKVIKSSPCKNLCLIIIRGLTMLKNTLHSDFFKLAFEDGTLK